PLLRVPAPVRARHAVVPEHHVVLDHGQPPRLGVAARPRRVLLALQARTLLDVGARAVEARLLVVPQREAYRPLRLHVGHAEDAGQLHDQGRARAVVVGRLAPAVPVQVGADDVHLLRTGGADLRAVDLLARAVRRGLAVQLAQPGVGLRFGVGVDAGP